MTLIIATCSPNVATVTADTRLSWNGELCDDNSAKIGCATFYDARLLYAYTGLANVGRFETKKWLLQSLTEVTKPWTKAEEVIRALKLRATQDFSTLPDLKNLDAIQKRLSIVFAGFLGQQPIAAVVSNFENLAESRSYSSAQDQFWFSGWPGAEGQSIWIACFGTVAAVSESALSILKSLVETSRHVDAIKGKAEAMIVQASKDPRSMGTIGANVLRASLPPGYDEFPTGGFTSETGGDELLLIDQFHYSGLVISHGTLSTEGAVPPRHRLRRNRKKKHTKLP